ncbi:MAG: hypothetical protein KatS3mg007_0881 [Thermoanaerobaculum sp.]|nr:MAG: hypothetical protein KatS3mg007_0881 [Thermoanaerobaculum sp.]
MSSAAVNIELPQLQNPLMQYLRQDRIPHIWCPGCGIGTSLNAFIRALDEMQFDLNKLAVISGIGCTGRVAGYLNVDSFHTTHGRAIPFATGLKLGNPDLKVVVYSGDGDLFAIGGNHFIHAARRNMDLMVVCVNNFTYGMTGGQVAPTTPLGATQTTMPYGNFEPPFNLPYLADSCGAVYVARWTVYHVRQLTRAFKEGLSKKGFVFHRGAFPLPDPLLPAEPPGRRGGAAQVLQGALGGEKRSGHPRGGPFLPGGHRGGNLRKPGAAHVAWTP